MPTEYGIRYKMNAITWGFSREQAESAASHNGVVALAREVSEPRIVSIRA